MIRLTKEQPQLNVFRYYLIQVVPGLFGQWGVLREWGRIGCRGTVRQDWHGTEAEAIQAAQVFLKAKQKRGYSVMTIGCGTVESSLMVIDELNSNVYHSEGYAGERDGF